MLAKVSPFVQSLEHIIGFMVVLVALTLLWALTILLGRFFSRNGATATRPAAPTPTAVPSGDSGPSEEEVVAISAAVSMLMGQRSRVVSLRSSGQDWSREGLRDHFASHRIR